MTKNQTNTANSPKIRSKFTTKKPEKVADLLGHILKRNDIIKKAKNYDFFDKWLELVGETYFKVSKPEKLYKGILSVRVIDSSFAQELSMIENKIIENLANMGFGGAVNKIKIIVGSPRDFK